MYKWDVKRDGKTAWVAPEEGETGTLATVKKMLSRNTPILTRLTIEGHGGIADATLYSHKKAKQDTYIPLKSSDARMDRCDKIRRIFKCYNSISFCL